MNTNLGQVVESIIETGLLFSIQSFDQNFIQDLFSRLYVYGTSYGTYILHSL